MGALGDPFRLVVRLDIVEEATTVDLAADTRVSTLIGIALPISRYDFSAIERSTKPKFFIHGEFDEICPLKDMREFYARCAEPKELIVIDAADHLFDGKVSQVADAIEDLLGDWS